MQQALSLPEKACGLFWQESYSLRAHKLRGVERAISTLAACKGFFPTYAPPEKTDFHLICACGRKLCEAFDKLRACCIRSRPCLAFIGGNYAFMDCSTATATATVAPTMGLLPMPRKPIISTCAGTEDEPANCASECMRPMVSVMP